MKTIFIASSQCLIFVSLSIYSLCAFADKENCRGIEQAIVQLHDVNYLPGATDGSPISAQIPVVINQAFKCDKNNPNDTSWVYKDTGFLITAPKTGLIGSDGSPIYSINGINGIGFTLGLKEPQYCGGNYRTTTDSNQRRSVCNSVESHELASAAIIQMQPYVVFYKIPGSSPLHDNNQPASIGQSVIGSVSLKVGDNSNGEGAREISGNNEQLYLSGFTIKYGSCAVTSTETTINVAMGSIPRNAFKGAGSRGGGKKSFSVHILCENTTSLKVGFFGNTTPENKDALSLLSEDNSATGVGITLTYGTGLLIPEGETVPLNTVPGSPVQNIQSAGQPVVMTFNAQYIQTGSTVTPGKADSIATFNLVYN